MVKKKTIKRVKLADSAQYPFPNSGVPQGPGGAAPTNNALSPNTRPTTPVDKNTGRRPFARTPFPSAAGATATSPTGTTTDGESAAFKTGSKPNYSQVGNSGTQIFGGYFSEEYLGQLRGRVGARQWDEMRRSEAIISMLWKAITNPIKAANWDFEPFDNSNDEYVKHAALMGNIFKDQLDFNTFKHEALTFFLFGFALFETIHNVVIDHPLFGTFNGLKALAFRSQKTIENWMLEQHTGKLMGVNQYTYSDLGGNQFIPGEFLLTLTNSKEGDNYEGISDLRALYGAYRRKELYLKLAAIGIEKYAVGTPIGTVPKGKEKTTEYEEFTKVLQNYTSHESAYITVPEGWKIEIQHGNFDAGKIKELIVLENTEMVNAFVANFLILGMHGNGSSLALGSNLLEFFTMGLQSYADLICDAVNTQLIPNLVKLNFGEQSGYPKLKVTGITNKAGKELAEALKFLADGRMIEPDRPLKEFIRKAYDLPKPDLDTATAMPVIPAGGAANYPKPNDPVVNPKTGKVEPFNPNQLLDQAELSECAKTLQLADKKYVAQFDKNKTKLKVVMKNGLHTLYSGLKNALRKRYGSLPDSSKILAAKGLVTPGLPAYKAELRTQLAGIAAQSIARAKKSLPKKLRLAETFQLADEDIYDELPPEIRKMIDALASIIGETQAADLEKIVFFQFTSGAISSDDIEAILHDVDEKALATIEGSTAEGMSVDAAAGDATAQITQGAAQSTYFDPEVIDEIESFTFTNEDPVSEICQALAGTTFAVGDPDLDQYSPPMHHNCKSRLVPNLKGDSDNPEIDRGGVAISQKALDSISLCDHAEHYRLSEDETRK